MVFFIGLENVNNDISAESTGLDKNYISHKSSSSGQYCVKSVLTNMDLFIQKCLCVQYSRRTTSERECGGSMGLLLARFDLCLPLGSTSALG